MSENELIQGFNLFKVKNIKTLVNSMTLVFVWLSIGMLLFMFPLAVSADNGEEDVFSDLDAAARKSSNPLGGDFMILLNQIDNYFMKGTISSIHRNLNTWSFQPVVPVPMKKLGENWIWVNRPTFPFIMNAELPTPKIDTRRRKRKASLLPGGGTPRIPRNFPGNVKFKTESGFGDIVYFSLLGQSLPKERWGGGDFVWAVGPTFQFPTASRDEFGSGRFSAGPSGVLSFIGKKFILGGLFQQFNSFGHGGKGSGDNVNFSWLNLFYFLNFKDGWQVGGTPIITSDWESPNNDRWTIPIGLGVYKTSFFGKMPIKMGLEFQYMAKRPDTFGQDFNLRITFAPIIPSLFKKN